MGTASALAALAMTRTTVRAAMAPGATRMSLQVFSQDSVRVESLRRGIAVMKALHDSDHRSWFFQAATHAYSDTLFAAARRRDPKLKTVDRAKYWNKCPHFGQSSADFLIWHRAYLHFFERNLRALAGDPTLALPYWDYGNPDQRTFPEIFAPEFLDHARTIRNSLYHPNRERSFARGLLEISASVGQAGKTVASANFFHEVGAPGLAGDELNSDHTQIGLLEQRPHNDIHLAVGGVINSTNGAMAEITTAAFDPVFWVHHTNIDRMWAEWASKPGKRWGPLPPDSWFDERPWTFLDVDGTEQTLSRREAMALLADYDVHYPQLLSLTVTPVTVASAEAPPPTAAPGGGERALPLPEAAGAEREERATAAMAPRTAAAPRAIKRAKPPGPAERELLADHRPLTVTPHISGQRQFGATPPAHPTADHVVKAAPAPQLNAPELGNPNAKVLLELAGITFKRVPSSGFAIFLDGGGKRATEPVGLIDIFGATHAGMHHMAGMPSATAVQRFDVTEIVTTSSGPFVLRVEPYDLLVTKGGKPGARRADAVRIGSVRFVVVG